VQVCSICTRLWKLPLVNIGGVDVAEGHRSALLSLAWQVMTVPGMAGDDCPWHGSDDCPWHGR